MRSVYLCDAGRLYQWPLAKFEWSPAVSALRAEGTEESCIHQLNNKKGKRGKKATF